MLIISGNTVVPGDTRANHVRACNTLLWHGRNEACGPTRSNAVNSMFFIYRQFKSYCGGAYFVETRSECPGPAAV